MSRGGDRFSSCNRRLELGGSVGYRTGHIVLNVRQQLQDRVTSPIAIPRLDPEKKLLVQCKPVRGPRVQLRLAARTVAGRGCRSRDVGARDLVSDDSWEPQHFHFSSDTGDPSYPHSLSRFLEAQCSTFCLQSWSS